MNKYTKYEVVHGINELFDNQEAEYRIIDYNFEMDNREALRYFIEYCNIPTDSIEEDFGTQIILFHTDYDFRLCIDSSGLGDFYSHGFLVSII
jgi:hypothetical protein